MLYPSFYKRALLGLVPIAYSLLTAVSAQAALNAADKIGGTMKAVIGGKELHFPVLKSDIKANIQGDLATVTVVQTFVNPTNTALNTSYLFPLNKDAAVYSMQMEVGDERIVAVIKKKAEARKVFEQAKRVGKVASLLTQHRPNMFTQELANLMPGAKIKVTLKYSQVVPRIDGAYELVIPLVVGPRYIPKPPKPSLDLVRLEQQQTAPKSGQWSFTPVPSYPAVSGLTIPDVVDKDRVSIHVDLEAGFPVQAVQSRTHALLVNGDEKKKTAALASGRTIDNADFVLRYQLAGKKMEAGLLAHHDKRGDFLSLLLEPPTLVNDANVTPREMVFLLDTSGSMGGLPIEASKTFMREAIKSLRPNDYFRIIRFSSQASEFATGSVLATPQNKRAGEAFVNSLRAGGGTEVNAGLEKAFGIAQQPGTMRIVTFLSDGYIGNEASVLGKIASYGKSARIYAFGVGAGVNRYLLSEMARMGRGFARFIDPTEDSNEAARDLAKRLEAPILTDISVDWGTLVAEGVTPQNIPDLFKGDSLRLMAKSTHPLEAGSTHIITIKGMVNGQKASLPLKVTIGEGFNDAKTEALPLVWARTQIAEQMRKMVKPVYLRRGQGSDEQIKKTVTKLGLDYSLMTQWTSFVAVSKRITNETPLATQNAQVPLNMVKGVSAQAYGQKINATPRLRVKPMQKASILPRTRQVAFNNPTSGSHQFKSFSGSSTPEPGTIAGMVLLLLLFGSLALRRRETV